MAEAHREQLDDGSVEVWRRDDGVWGVSWHPREGQTDYPATTYIGGGDLTPDDFPTEYDPEELLAWARKEWGTP